MNFIRPVFRLLAPAALFFLCLAATARSEPAIWTVRDHDTTIHLFGTLHLLPEGLEWMSDDIRQKLGRTQRIYMELSPDEITPEKSMAALNEFGLLPAGTTLAARLSEPVHGKLQRYLEAEGMHKAMYDQMRPWLVAITISLREFDKQGLDETLGSESILRKHAADHAVEIRGLETMRLQLSLFASLPPEREEAFLEITLDQIGAVDSMTDEMTRSWVNGDEARLEAVLLDSFGDMPELAERMLYQRNRNWVPQIKEVMAEPGVFFIAVGAGHLLGDQGVPALLEQAGYQVGRAP